MKVENEDKELICCAIFMAIVFALVAIIMVVDINKPVGPSCDIERITDLDDGKEYKVFRQRSNGKIIKIEEVTEK
jgi:hypothetical protein